MTSDQSSPFSSSGSRSSITETADQALWRLWQQGPRPDLAAFFRARPTLSPREVAAVLAVDQHERWKRGERVRAEDYLALQPGVSQDAELACDIVYGEYLLRESLGEKPTEEEYCRRFPALAGQLSRQIEVHRLLGADHSDPVMASASVAGLVGDCNAPPTLHVTNETTASGQGAGPAVRIPGYEVLEEIGRGGMGVVYKARQLWLQRMVALKVVAPGEIGSEEGQPGLDRLVQEARMTAQLAHPHIVTVFDAGRTEGGGFFFAMEYVPGIDLHRLVEKEGPLSVARACDYIRQAALGLEHAHAHGLIHRDVKPSNLIVTGATSAPCVKLLDLGLAREFLNVGESSVGTRTSFMGTPDFVAPEQAVDPRSADARSDLYSLGCTFYFLLTGRPPFAGPTPSAKLAQHHSEEPVALDELRPDVPPGVSAIIRKLMSKDPRQRFASAADLAASLSAFGQAGEGTAPTRSNKERPPRIIEGHGDWVKGVAFDPSGQFLASAGLDGTLRMHETKTGRQLWSVPGQTGGVFCVAFTSDGDAVATGGKDRLVRLFSRASGKEIWRGAGHTDNVNAIACIPDPAPQDNGLIVSGSHDGTLRVWYRQSGQTIRSWSAHAGPVWGVVAARGDLVVSAGNDRMIRSWNLRSGAKVKDFPEQSMPVTCVAVSADGRLVLSGGMDEVVRLWDLATGSCLARLHDHSGKVTGVAFFPDGRQAVSGSRDRSVRIWELTTGKMLANRVGHTNWVTGVAVSPDGHLLASAGADRMICIWEVG